MRNTSANAIHCPTGSAAQSPQTQVVFLTVLSVSFGLASGLKQPFKKTSREEPNLSHLVQIYVTEEERSGCNAAETTVIPGFMNFIWSN